ncbi:MAG: hypothetical protein NC117_01465 [Pseudoflavonifractor sp.]|nr:hypothetical protein [Pseudoflavonifractor sp.]
MRILLLGDASNYHNALSVGLRQLGHEVTVASAGSRWMMTGRDIDLSRPLAGKVGGALLWLKIQSMMSRLSGYDVVQLVNPIFVELRPHRVKALFDQLRRRNGSVFLTALGNDTRYVRMANDPSALRYSEWQVAGRPTPYALSAQDVKEAWLGNLLGNHCDYIYSHVDGIATALYEYHLACKECAGTARVSYCGIPVDTAAVERKCCQTVPDKVRLFIGLQRGRMLEKGTDRLLAAAKDVVARYPDRAELVTVENRPYDEYISLMNSCHVMLDQLYSYTPATNALLAMSRGMTVISGGEPEYYDFIGETENRPIINAIPDDTVLRSLIEDVVLHPERLPMAGHLGREFVMKHNDTRVVAERFVRLWEGRD